MKSYIVYLMMAVLLLVMSAGAQQTTAGSGSATVVPQLINFSGVAKAPNGQPMTGLVGITFALYQEQQGGAPLWLETQNVQLDPHGNYTVQLGATLANGLPTSLFTSGEARWVGVQISGQEEQPRVMLLSVPYAMKAGDAQTLNGQPASAFLTAVSSNAASGNGVINNAISGSGTTDYVPLWLSKSKLGSSKIFQSTAGDLGIGTTTPAANLDVNGTSDIRNTLTLFPNGSSPTLSINGTAFQVSSTGTVTFVSGQTFPGTGTITGVTAGAGLSGGGSSGNVTLSVPSSGITNAMLQNSSLTVTAGTDLTGGGAVSLGGSTTLNVDTTKVPQLVANNTFSGTQTINNNVTVTATGTTLSASGGSVGLYGVGTGYGVYGWTGTNTASGVAGQDASAGGGYGVSGTSTYGTGVYASSSYGAYGLYSVGYRYGVYGAYTGGVYGVAGVYGYNTYPGNSGVEGMDASGGAFGMGVYGYSSSGIGVSATSASGEGVTAYALGSGDGVYGYSGSGNGVYGATEGSGYGVSGESQNGTGVCGLSPGGAVNSCPEGLFGVYGSSNNGTGVYGAGYTAGVVGSSTSGYGVSGSSSSSAGLYGNAPTGVYGVGADYGVYGLSTSGYAGYFAGNVDVTGTLRKGGGSFKIDHPLDPANKFLYHSFVESPDMMNIYNGNVILDEKGTAWITLPDYFEALNRDFRYQLTAIGAPGPNLYIAEKIRNNRFQIAGGKPGGEVSWQVTGIRHDAFANAHRIIPEVEKTGDERGKYLHPVENGQPESMGIDYERRAKMQPLEPPKPSERAAHIVPPPRLEPPKLQPPRLPQLPVPPKPPQVKPPVAEQHVTAPEPQK